MNLDDISAQDTERLYQRLNKEAEQAGYHLNPDVEFTKDLVEGLLVNERRYGYWACPCRLATGVESEDLDIICPCDYRDADLDEFGACFCALYVSAEIKNGEKKARSIPERRPPAEQRMKMAKNTTAEKASGLPVWRCKVCGYLCARESPPLVCPICKAQKERFEAFAFGAKG